MITRDELLTKLAVECATWDEAIKKAVDIEMQCGLAIKPLISKDDWLAERERLLNRPSWDDAPRWASFLALDEDGKWFWYGFMVEKGHVSWIPFDYSLCELASESVIIPAGYDWRESLEARP